jgi:hypothetical protein
MDGFFCMISVPSRGSHKINNLEDNYSWIDGWSGTTGAVWVLYVKHIGVNSTVQKRLGFLCAK